MKHKILIIIGIMLAMSVQAQWYANQHGVTNMNDLNLEQLQMSLDQAMKLKKAGVITTVASTAVTIIGLVMYSNGLDQISTASTYGGIDDGAERAYSGAGVFYMGLIGECVGIPLWIAGAQRTNIIKVHMAKFQPMGYQQPAYGVGLSLTF